MLPKRTVKLCQATEPRSWDDWPSWAADVGELRTSGFVYTGVRDVVRCTSCGLLLDRFSDDDLPLPLLHLQLQPRCSQLQKMLQTYRLPDSVPRRRGGESAGFYRRLGSFDTWPRWAAVRPHHLARLGYIHTGAADEVECNCCHVRLRHWTRFDLTRSFELHRACGRALMTISSNKPNDSVVQRISTTEVDDLRDRLDTFKNWPKSEKCSPLSLSLLGAKYCSETNSLLYDTASSEALAISQWDLFCELNSMVDGREFTHSTQPKVDSLKDQRISEKKLQVMNIIERAATLLQTGRDGEELDKLVKQLGGEWGTESPGNLCIACEENPINVLIRPCKHAAVCDQCSKKLTHCAICRGNILNIERIYIR